MSEDTVQNCLIYACNVSCLFRCRSFSVEPTTVAAESGVNLRATTWETSTVINYVKLLSQWEQGELHTTAAPAPIRLNVLYNEPPTAWGRGGIISLPPRPPIERHTRCTVLHTKCDILLSSAPTYARV